MGPSREYTLKLLVIIWIFFIVAYRKEYSVYFAKIQISKYVRTLDSDPVFNICVVASPKKVNHFYVLKHGQKAVKIINYC